MLSVLLFKILKFNFLTCKINLYLITNVGINFIFLDVISSLNSYLSYKFGVSFIIQAPIIKLLLLNDLQCTKFLLCHLLLFLKL
ncbi:hypothetical protein KU05112810_1090006 [Flavobacterium psychrophilum]|nr:hypothetical protein KU05112810_1090006 [Flavobacterium psychrophilum]